MPLLDEIIKTFLEASPYLLLGLFFSGILQSFISKKMITSWIGKNDTRSVAVAAAAGVPLPLCSCGVIPMAISLRQNGASRGATIAFLISTPETGLDSITLSLALLDPVMAIFRPIAAFVTALIAGVMENILGKTEISKQEESLKDCCSTKEHADHDHPKFIDRLKKGFYDAFVTLLGDIGPWLILGLVLSGLISYAVPQDLIEKFLGNGLSSMLLMLVIGIPLYICASASTPIAASLLLKGADPGAVLVFLLAGPATNVTTILMVNRFLGVRALIIYLATISLCSLGAGFMLNAIYAHWNIDIRQTIGQAAHCVDTSWQMASAAILAICLSYALIKKWK